MQKLKTAARALQIFIPMPSQISHLGWVSKALLRCVLYSAWRGAVTTAHSSRGSRKAQGGDWAWGETQGGEPDRGTEKMTEGKAYSGRSWGAGGGGVGVGGGGQPTAPPASSLPPGLSWEYRQEAPPRGEVVPGKVKAYISLKRTKKRL